MPIAKQSAGPSEINRAELIRQAAKKIGKTVRPRDIVADLKAQGVTVSSTLVSKTLKRAGFHRKGAGKKAAGRTKASFANGKLNKAQRIRDVAKALGKKFRPRDVIAELATQGITVSAAQVSTTLRAAGYRRKRRGKKATGAAAPVANGLNLGALLAAKLLIHKAGGVKAAEAAIQAMKKLG